MEEKYDFSGWATKNDLLCGDGRVIRRDAFKENDGTTVPLVWMHSHNDPSNVLGHAYLQNKPEGVYAYCSLNDTENGKAIKESIRHGDVTSLSIYANNIKQQGKNVIHGRIREVSLVLAGANPGAVIENPVASFAHGEDGEDAIDTSEAIIFTGNDVEMNTNGDVIEHAEPKGESKEMAAEENKPEKKSDDSGKTVQDVIDTMNEEQKKVLNYLIGLALEDGKKGSEKKENADEEPEVKHSDVEEGDTDMSYNVFEQNGETKENAAPISHSDIKNLEQSSIEDAKHFGSLKDSFIAHASNDYGITNIGYLFPDAKNYTTEPQFIQRQTAWVNAVMSGVHQTPFSRVKSTFANITADAARAKGYIKGKLKKEEVFSLLKRTTDPQTIYKKQKLDRDDILDITDFNVVSWVKSEMRSMLNEEIARAVLFGDGRLSSDDDKISPDHIRPVISDASLYTISAEVGETDSTVAAVAELIPDELVIALDDYRGSGNITAFVRQDIYTRMLLLKDKNGYRLYKSRDELATAMSVNTIVPVPNEIMGDTYVVALDLTDYNIGADKGGEVNMFDDFDIDYNQQKYLMETRCSGALVKPYSAIVLKKKSATVSGS